MDIGEKQLCLNNADSAKKLKRTRIVAKRALICSLGSDKDDSFTSSGDSEDEWNVSCKKECRRNKKAMPKQTLKTKLLEKTRKLRQLSKLNGTSVLVGGREPTQGNVSPTSPICDKEKHCPTSSIKMKLEPNFNENGIETTLESKSSLNKLKNESKQVSDEADSKKTKKERNQEPIVIEYSINRFHVPGVNTPGANFSQLCAATSDSLPSSFQINPSSASQAVSDKNTVFANHCGSFSFNNAGDQSPHCRRNVSSSQFPSSINVHISPRVRSNTHNITPANRRKISKTKPNCTVSQKAPAADSQKISTVTRLNNVKIVKNFKSGDASVTKSRRMFLSNQKVQLSNLNKIPENNSDVLMVDNGIPLKGSSSLLKTGTNRVLNKFGDIPPNGTVIHTGTGCVTITPRKTVPEKPPKQRKLFKNEIEGTISGRNIEGILRYVVNLANGTFIPLSDLQVKKLREQHKGALPIKLKIPVPCDVADKIEPSFLIED